MDENILLRYPTWNEYSARVARDEECETLEKSGCPDGTSFIPLSIINIQAILLFQTCVRCGVFMLKGGDEVPAGTPIFEVSATFSPLNPSGDIASRSDNRKKIECFQSIHKFL